MSTLGLSMIVKDEPVDRMVALIHFMSQICDQIVVLDTGSEYYQIDRQWYSMAGATTVEQIEWRNDFSWARNQTLQHLSTDWTLHLDADEMPTKKMLEHIDWVLNNATPQQKGVLYLAQNFWGGRKELEVFPSDWHVRMFRTRLGEWYKPVHEQVRIEGKDESATRGTPAMISAPKDAYFINSKPADAIERSNALYKYIGEGADKRSI